MIEFPHLRGGARRAEGAAEKAQFIVWGKLLYHTHFFRSINKKQEGASLPAYHEQPFVTLKIGTFYIITKK